MLLTPLTLIFRNWPDKGMAVFVLGTGGRKRCAVTWWRGGSSS